MRDADLATARIEQARHLVSIVGLCAIAVGLTAGLAASLTGVDWLATRAFAIAAGLLVVMPIAAVVAVLAVEISRRDWLFASAALGVLLLIGYRLIGFLR